MLCGISQSKPCKLVAATGRQLQDAVIQRRRHAVARAEGPNDPIGHTFNKDP